MFDFVKLEIVDLNLRDKLLDNCLLNFGTQINERSGEVLSIKQSAEYRNMTFIMYPTGWICISGSLHKLFNSIYLGKEINHDVFSFWKVSYTVAFLQEYFEIDPAKMKISNLEFGVNIKPLISADKIIKSLIVFKYSPFSKMKTRTAGFGVDCYLSEYAIKVYNKGKQYKLEENILRYEMKVFKMRSEFNKRLMLNDLLDKKLWKKCALSLLKSINNVIIIEPLNSLRITKPEINQYNECSNPRNWGNFTIKQRSQKKKKFNQLIAQHGTLQIKVELNNLIKLVVNQMMNEINIINPHLLSIGNIHLQMKKGACFHHL